VVPGFQRVLRILRSQGSRNPMLQVFMVSRLQDVRALDYRVPELSRVPGLQCHGAKFEACTRIPRMQISKVLGLIQD